MTRKQNLQANSRSACQFWHEREGSTEVIREVAHTLSFYFLPKGFEIKLIFTLRAAIIFETRMIFKISIFGHEIWNLKKGPNVPYVLFFYPIGSKLSLHSLYGQPFLRYTLTFKIAIFGHETWPLRKVPEVPHMLSFYPRGSKLSLFSLYRKRFLRYGQIFKIAIFGHEIFTLKKDSKVAFILSF